jgi:hypothetical protein
MMGVGLGRQGSGAGPTGQATTVSDTSGGENRFHSLSLRLKVTHSCSDKVLPANAGSGFG